MTETRSAPGIQRKIHHLLKSDGIGKDFHYLPELSIPFDLANCVIVTEKVDGTTMQCLGGVPYKRYDNFSSGDTRKHSASEADRYRLEMCRKDNPAEKWYFAAFDHHQADLQKFSLSYPDVWVYFEALHSKIGGRFKGTEVEQIRVFDMGDNGGFFKFDRTEERARQFGLPLVYWHPRVFGGLDALLDGLRVATSQDPHLPDHKLEGWVLRQGDLVGKIRVDDLKKLKTA